MPDRNGGPGARHLYVHLPFCVHRCGYCDFVTVVGRQEQHGAYVDALLAELVRERRSLADEVETVYLGGGTPTFTEQDALARLLAALPPARELTVEANPETVTPALVEALVAGGVNRVSLGAQSFQARLLATLERRTTPAQVRRAVELLREGGIGNVSLDLIYGIPGERPDDLARDLDELAELAPEHVSAYELEAKPGTRFTHAHGAALARQGEALEGHFEAVVERLETAGYRWYETASFARVDTGRDWRGIHNLGYWRGSDYLGLGIGAVSTLADLRRRNAPRLAPYLEALAAGAEPPRELEPLDEATRAAERLMLGLRLDEPLALDDVVRSVLDSEALERLAGLGLLESDDGRLRLTRRGRFLGGAVTADLVTLRP